MIDKFLLWWSTRVESIYIPGPLFTTTLSPNSGCPVRYCNWMLHKEKRPDKKEDEIKCRISEMPIAPGFLKTNLANSQIWSQKISNFYVFSLNGFFPI